MSSDVGTFRIDVELENPVAPGERRTVHSAQVDTGAELSWFPSAILQSLGIERNQAGPLSAGYGGNR